MACFSCTTKLPPFCRCLRNSWCQSAPPDLTKGASVRNCCDGTGWLSCSFWKSLAQLGEAGWLANVGKAPWPSRDCSNWNGFAGTASKAENSASRLPARESGVRKPWAFYQQAIVSYLSAGRQTWAGEYLGPVRRSCCRVRSTCECFWKDWRGFDGPQSASAIFREFFQLQVGCWKVSIRWRNGIHEMKTKYNRSDFHCGENYWAEVDAKRQQRAKIR